MPLTESQHQQLQDFFNQSRFEEIGGVITDLDGTAIHEFEGRYSIPRSVELALIKIYQLGRPVVINTLRFPWSVIRTFGQDWYKISNAPIPTVLMNGSQLGYVVQDETGALGYEEITAFPLTPEEINAPLQIVEQFIRDGVGDLLVFYYPRDWRQGEIIWTPLEEKVPAVKGKYLSASTVYAASGEQLKADLLAQEICMIFLLIDIPQDKLMAYQHTKQSNFFTRAGVDKRFGAEQIAQHLGFDLHHSVGAGDSEMDRFLSAMGLAIHVGNPFLSYEGVLPSIKVGNSAELGELLFELAAMQRNVVR
jgi:hydroxymethylpyrimidine pyrophosphatase-like HAD family hydrolase